MAGVRPIRPYLSRPPPHRCTARMRGTRGGASWGCGTVGSPRWWEGGARGAPPGRPAASSSASSLEGVASIPLTAAPRPPPASASTTRPSARRWGCPRTCTEDSFRSTPQSRHIPAHSLRHMSFIGMFIAAYWMAGSVRSSTWSGPTWKCWSSSRRLVRVPVNGSIASRNSSSMAMCSGCTYSARQRPHMESAWVSRLALTQMPLSVRSRRTGPETRLGPLPSRRSHSSSISWDRVDPLISRVSPDTLMYILAPRRC